MRIDSYHKHAQGRMIQWSCLPLASDLFNQLNYKDIISQEKNSS